MGVFDFVDIGLCPYYENAYWAISECDLWEWLRDLELPDECGFIYYKCPELDHVRTKMQEQPIGRTHNELSYNTTMRVMQFIVHRGIAAYKLEYLCNPHGHGAR